MALSLTGNRLKCLNSNPAENVKVASNAFAGFRIWGTVAVAATNDSVSFDPDITFTYGRTGTEAPTGSMNFDLSFVAGSKSSSINLTIGSVPTEYVGSKEAFNTLSIAKTHSAQTVTVYIAAVKKTDGMRRYRYYQPSGVQTRTFPVHWNSDTSNAYNYTGTDKSYAATTYTIPAKPSYTIYYNANGGSSTPGSQTKWYGEAITLASAISRSGYTFAGWKWNNSGSAYGAGTSWNGANSSGTFYAAWTANNYTLSYNANGGSVSPTSKTVACGSAYGTLPTPTRTGHTFAGWYTAGGSQVTASTVMGAGNTTIYAHWTVNKYRLTYNTNGTTAHPATVSPTYNDINYGGNYILPTPSRTGYTFLGWYTDATGGSKVSTSNTMPAYAVTIYAHWSINTYRLNYNANGGTVTPAYNDLTYDTNYVLPTPTRDDYLFKGWFTAASGGTQVTTSNKMPAAATTIYAQWIDAYIAPSINSAIVSERVAAGTHVLDDFGEHGKITVVANPGYRKNDISDTPSLTLLDTYVYVYYKRQNSDATEQLISNSPLVTVNNQTTIQYIEVPISVDEQCSIRVVIQSYDDSVAKKYANQSGLIPTSKFILDFNSADEYDSIGIFTAAPNINNVVAIGENCDILLDLDDNALSGDDFELKTALRNAGIWDDVIVL